MKQNKDKQPNILWIMCEDIGPHLGCYGDSYAKTPNLDRLAKRGMYYKTAWSNAPVCAPARTCIISGVNPPSSGSEHMRSMVPYPESFKLYPEFLRDKGYYCTNNAKEDFNIAKNRRIWDESSNEAHWKNRGGGQPFYSVFNLGQSHEEAIRAREHEFVHDPDKATLPSYYPDTPVVREDWAHYYSSITSMDKAAGRLLDEVEEAGLMEDTIIFFFGDHGSGMPRHKRTCHDSGLRVPLVIYVPEKYRHLAPAEYEAGGASERMVGFVDLAPTILSIIGTRPAEYFQGHAFMGMHEEKPQDYLYGYRGRMDASYDLVRAVRNERYIYIRNFMPHLPLGQYVRYMFLTNTTRIWKESYDKGELNEARSRFWEAPRDPEELYDLWSDPYEVNNLALSAGYDDMLDEMRNVLEKWQIDIRDVDLLPEPEMHRRSEGSTPYEMGHDSEKYPVEKILRTAGEAGMLKENALPRLIDALDDPDSGVRYWGAMGLVMRGGKAIREAGNKLVERLRDVSPSVRMAAAEALISCGNEYDANKSMEVLSDCANIRKHDAWTSIYALNILYNISSEQQVQKQVSDLPVPEKSMGSRGPNYIVRLIEQILEKSN